MTVVLKSALMESGALSVMLCGTRLILPSYVVHLDMLKVKERRELAYYIHNNNIYCVPCNILK